MSGDHTIDDVTDFREPGYRTAYSVNKNMYANNLLDDEGNPTGGSVSLIRAPFKPFVSITWQNGPRGNADGTLDEPNGAFIEDVLWAALQRLEFFNETKYRDRSNSIAITHIEQALQALHDRSLERAYRGVEGKHEV
jgi:hypothetical protein